jgi:hypothetical protein
LSLFFLQLKADPMKLEAVSEEYIHTIKPVRIAFYIIILNFCMLGAD